MVCFSSNITHTPLAAPQNPDLSILCLCVQVCTSQVRFCSYQQLCFQVESFFGIFQNMLHANFKGDVCWQPLAYAFTSLSEGHVVLPKNKRLKKIMGFSNYSMYICWNIRTHSWKTIAFPDANKMMIQKIIYPQP